MNIIIFFYLLLLSILNPLYTNNICEPSSFARSFMLTRPASYRQPLHQHLWHNVYYSGKGDCMSNHNLAVFYQKSVRNHNTDRYFLINHKTNILISGDSNTQDQYDRDVRAEWLGLPSNFRGTLALSPEQKQIGCWLEFNQQFKRFFEFELLKDYWMMIRLPIIFVDNKLNARYCTQQNSGTLTLEEAFNNPAWCFSKIVKERSRVGLAEIRVSLGKTFIDEDYFQLGYETTLIIPTASKQDPRYMFDAVVGINGHAALGNKLTFQVLLNRDPIHAAWTFFANLEAFLLIPNTQRRTFDLRGEPIPNIELRQKQWSRFLMYTKQDGTIIPGVNILTRKAVVKPYTLVDFSAGWRLKIKKFEFELGYDFWGHGQEKLRFHKKLYPDNSTHPEPFGILGSAPGITASNSTIDTKAADDTSFVEVNDSDFDRHSAAASTALTHSVHFSTGALYQGIKTDSFLGFGAFFEYPQKNSALMNYGIWGKVGASF